MGNKQSTTSAPAESTVTEINASTPTESTVTESIKSAVYHPPPKVISIEGNIGAGKTTILEQLLLRAANDPSIVFLREPVDNWSSIQSADGENILTKFYKDPARYAFTFQVMAYATRVSSLRKIICENPQCKLVICERSLEADRNIFAKMLFCLV